MAEHRGARPARGPAGVEQHGQRLGVGAAGRRRAGRPTSWSQVRSPSSGRYVDADDARRRGRLVPERLERLAHPDDGRTHSADRGRVGDHHAGTGVGQHPDHLAGGAARVDRHRDHARAQHAVVGRDELDPVGDRDHHPVAGHHAGVGQPVRDPVGQVVERGPGDAAAGRGLREGDPVGLGAAAVASRSATLVSIRGVSHTATGPASADPRGDDLGWACDARIRPRPHAREPQAPLAAGRRGRGGRRRGREQPVGRGGPEAAAFFDVDNTVMQGASIYHLAKGLHRRKFFTTRDIAGRGLEAGLLPGGRRRGPRARRGGALGRAGVHRRAHRRGAGVARRGDLRRGDGPPDLAGHPGARPAAPRPGPAGLAGDRRPDRDRHDHRPPSRPDRRPRHGGRAHQRRLHRPAGRRDAARAGQGRGDPARSPSARGSTWRGARRTPTPTTTCRCSRWSATRAQSTRTRKLRAHARAHGWRVRDYRTGRRAARAGAVHRRGRRGGGRQPRRRDGDPAPVYADSQPGETGTKRIRMHRCTEFSDSFHKTRQFPIS